MKKILVLILAGLIIFSFAGCGGAGGVDVFKVGMILPEGKDAPDMKQYAAMLEWAAEECDVDGKNVKIEYGVSEADDFTEEAKSLSKDGCDVIFVVSGGVLAEHVEKAAKESPTDVFMLIANEEEVAEKSSLGNVKYAFINETKDEATETDAQQSAPQDSEVSSDAEAVSDAEIKSDAEAGSDSEVISDAEVSSDSEKATGSKSESGKESPYGKLGDYVKKVISDVKSGKTIAVEWVES